MRIAVATVQVPFMHGGAEYLASGLLQALKNDGHSAEIVTMPFRFSPPNAILNSMENWTREDFSNLNGFQLDRVICLKFPTYYLQHPKKRVWLLHQHRDVYDIWETPFSGSLPLSIEGKELRERIHEADNQALNSCGEIFTIAQNVTNRLLKFNNINSTPIYHPPRLADSFYCEYPQDYIFYPSRLEGSKRQQLLVDAMAYVDVPVVALLAGSGGLFDFLSGRINDLGLGNRVKLLGQITEDELLAYHALAMGVFFGPYDEDYGYVTLEAMLSSKPVITCVDSGGPLEFVVPNETGFVVPPEPTAIAEAITWLYNNKQKAISMGRAGRNRYDQIGIGWENVLERLL